MRWQMKLIYHVKRRFKQIVLPRIEGLPRISYLILEIATDNWNTDETDLARRCRLHSSDGDNFYNQRNILDLLLERKS